MRQQGGCAHRLPRLAHSLARAWVSRVKKAGHWALFGEANKSHGIQPNIIENLSKASRLSTYSSSSKDNLGKTGVSRGLGATLWWSRQFRRLRFHGSKVHPIGTHDPRQAKKSVATGRGATFDAVRDSTLTPTCRQLRKSSTKPIDRIRPTWMHHQLRQEGGSAKSLPPGRVNRSRSPSRVRTFGAIPRCTHGGSIACTPRIARTRRGSSDACNRRATILR
eukprot:scaffold754_cov289-Pavlova_lutheri.AAC.3